MGGSKQAGRNSGRWDAEDRKLAELHLLFSVSSANQSKTRPLQIASFSDRRYPRKICARSTSTLA